MHTRTLYSGILFRGSQLQTYMHMHMCMLHMHMHMHMCMYHYRLWSYFIYRWTLLSRSMLVAQRSPLCYQAWGLQLSTWQSSEPWSELEHKPSPRNNASEARYPGLRGGSMDDGASRDERHSTLYHKHIAGDFKLLR